MKNSCLFIAAACLLMSSVSVGALNAYLTLEGETQGAIEGSVTQAGREGMIMVIAYNHEVFAPRDPSNGLRTDALQHEPLRITKEIDRSTPLLMAALTTNERLTVFELQFYQPSKTGAEVQFYTIRLQNARIVSIRQEMLNNKYPENMQHKEREHVTFVYDKIEWVYVPYGIATDNDWHYVGADRPISDLTGDGIVNLYDLAVLADEWLLYGH